MNLSELQSIMNINFFFPFLCMIRAYVQRSSFNQIFSRTFWQFHVNAHFHSTNPNLSLRFCMAVKEEENRASASNSCVFLTNHIKCDFQLAASISLALNSCSCLYLLPLQGIFEPHSHTHTHRHGHIDRSLIEMSYYVADAAIATWYQLCEWEKSN